MIIKKIIQTIFELNFKTIIFNFKHLPFKQAIKLPIFLSRHVYLMNSAGKIVLEGPIRSKQIKIGYKNVGIFDHKKSRTIWQVKGTVILQGNIFIGHGSKISVGPSGILKLGDGFIITAESAIVVSQTTVTFGKKCLVSWDTLIADTDFHKIYNADNVQVNEPREISIGEHVWIGCRCTILKGSNIPNNTIIAANSLVTAKRIEGENKIFGGQPVSEIKSDIRWSI